MYAKVKGIHVKQKNVKNAKGTKKVIFEYRHDLKDELDCDKGYVDDVKCNGRKFNKNRCKDNDTSYKDDDISYKDVGSCKDDDTSYKDVGSCKDNDTSYRDDGSCNDNSTSWRNDMMKSPKSPMWHRCKIDDNDRSSRNLVGTNEVIDLCTSDDNEND